MTEEENFLDIVTRKARLEHLATTVRRLCDEYRDAALRGNTDLMDRLHERMRYAADGAKDVLC